MANNQIERVFVKVDLQRNFKMWLFAKKLPTFSCCSKYTWETGDPNEDIKSCTDRWTLSSKSRNTEFDERLIWRIEICLSIDMSILFIISRNTLSDILLKETTNTRHLRCCNDQTDPTKFCFRPANRSWGEALALLPNFHGEKPTLSNLTLPLQQCRTMKFH